MKIQSKESICVETDQTDISMDNSISVVCLADNRYSMPLSTTLHSIIKNIAKGSKLNVFIIDGGIKESNRSKIIKGIDLQYTTVQWLQPDLNFLAGIKPQPNNHVTLTALLKFIIADILPNYLHKVIYLDCDLIVQTDLSKLWNVSINDNYLLAVQDMGIPYVSSPNGLINYQELKIADNQKYFNSGVLVINLEKWRSDNISVKAMKYLRENESKVRKSIDQDVLNVVVEGQWGELDPCWNQQPPIYMYKSYRESPFSETIYQRARQQPYIVHFVHFKPWSSKVPHPYREKFYEYLDMTAWKGWRYRLHQYLWDKAIYKLKKLATIIKSWIKSS